MNAQEALVQLSHSTAEAVAEVLRTFCGDEVVTGSVAVLPRGANPLATMRPPIITADVSYAQGVSGGNMLAVPAAGAAKLARAMTGDKDVEAPEGGLSEVALAAVYEAMNQMMAAAATATGEALGTGVGSDTPRIATFDNPDAALDGLQQNVHVTAVTFEVDGELCRLIQLVPKTFSVRLTAALEEMDDAVTTGPADFIGPHDPAVSEALRDVKLHVWAELGRTHMVASRAVSLQPGAVVDLDRAVEDPVDLYVNGCRLGTGRLTVDDDAQWVIEILGLEPLENLGLDGVGEMLSRPVTTG